MYNKFETISICKIVATVPRNIANWIDGVAGSDKEKDVRKKIRMTGVKNRHIVSDDTTTADLCYHAAESVISELGWDRNDISFLVFVSQTPNYKLPSTAFYLQSRLGIGKQCFCFDVNLGCSGYVGGIQIISSLMSNCTKETKALLLVGDVLSRCVDEGDSATSLLFGDAGSATAFICEKNASLYCMNSSDGSNYDRIIMRNDIDRLHMDGASVFEFTIGQVADGIREFEALYEIGKEDVDYYVFHQAQKFIVSNLTDILGIDSEKVLKSYEDYGNTSVASIPLSICANRQIIGEEREHKKKNFLLSGFGVGLAWGNVFCQIDIDAIGEILIIPEMERKDKP